MNQKQPWLTSYDAFCPTSLSYPDLNIVQVLEETVRNYPDRTSLHYLGAEMTYKQLDKAAENLAKHLKVLGIKEGDRVAVMYPNSPEFVISFFATLKIQAIVVALNPLYKAAELSRILSECDVKIVITSETSALEFEKIENKPSQFILSKEDEFQNDELIQKFGRVQLLKKDIEVQDRVVFSDCLKREIKDIELKIDFKQTAPAIFQYSGGTTGIPKAAIGLHQNLVSNAVQFSTWCDLKLGQEIFMAAIPLYHVYGMVLAMVLGISLAAKIVLIPNPRDIPYLLQSIADHQVTFFPGVPNIYAAINNNKDVLAGKYDLRSIKACISGSATLHPMIKEKFEQLTGGKLVEGYGLSEAPTATHCNPLFGENRVGSFGLPLPDVDCKVVEADNETVEVPIGEIGELLIRGPQVMAGYHNNQEETVGTLKNGWLHTGDIVRMDEKGYFYLVDRKKDLIKVGGFQVWPNEVEDILLRFPGVKEAAVAGVSDEMGKEKVIAWIVFSDDDKQVDTGLIQNFCRDHLAGYKIPKEVYTISAVPRSGVGKVLRRELVRMYKQKQP